MTAVRKDIERKPHFCPYKKEMNLQNYTIYDHFFPLSKENFDTIRVQQNFMSGDRRVLYKGKNGKD